ncbi:MAG: hypothetical protein AB8F95_05830 [Bacteroidia bacterium]
MKNQISKGIERLSLHDSHIEELARYSDKMVLTFDWAGLANYEETDVSESIVLGKCILELYGLKNEKLELEFSGGLELEDWPPKEASVVSQPFQDRLVLENKFTEKGLYQICGFSEYKDALAWTKWRFSFTRFTLSWDNFITGREWRLGHSVVD